MKAIPRTLCAALIAAGYGLIAHHASAHDDDHSHAAEMDGLKLQHAWVRAGDGSETLLFVEIENNSDADIMITGGETEIAESVELVGFQMKGGETVYDPLPPVPIKAGTEMKLAPNGLALRLNGVSETMVEGEEHEIEIEFDIGHVEMHFQVEAAGANQHSHAGHNH